MKKSKATDFKKGDKVVYISMANGVSLYEGEVTMVMKQANTHTPSGLVIQPVVHVKYEGPFGNTWKRTFAEKFGRFQEDPYPLWQLRKVDGLDLKRLKRTLTKIDKNYHTHKGEMEKMERQLEHDAYVWKCEERDRRKALIPHDWDYLHNAIRRAGFPSPNGTKMNRG